MSSSHEARCSSTPPRHPASGGYFSALALGLLAGLPTDVNVLTGALMALIVLTMYVGDHPRLFGRHRQLSLRLDSAYTDDEALRAHLEVLLGGRVVNMTVKGVDLVNDTTQVNVRYVVTEGSQAPREAATAPARQGVEA
ncbi:DUF4956 domain-containing protein [Streptomyces bottropensis]|uniref:DUF4956 domain-containing protein n=1 Tax=Streptomyces bottropensis TaxID=42235 RepID=A0ABU8B1E1_9ACTN